MDGTGTTQTSTPASSEELAGELAPFAEAVGSPGAVASMAALAELLGTTPPRNPPGVRQLLERYRSHLLQPVELPAIRDAYLCASRGEVRELVELDRRLSERFGHCAFAAASRQVGRLQLRRLRPLRDRTLQRYLKAVESGEAAGWHVVVYGLLLALFSFPLRQALAHYTGKTQQALLDSATARVAVPREVREEIERGFDDLPPLPLPGSGGPQLAPS